MKHTVNIIVSIKKVIKKQDIELSENISNIQTFYFYLKEKCNLPKLGKGEVCICSKDKNRNVTLFVISDAGTVLYSPFEDISMFASISPLYISYCSTVARAEEIFLANQGSHYYMWHEGYEDEYSKYGIVKELEVEWLQKHGLSPQIP